VNQRLRETVIAFFARRIVWDVSAIILAGVVGVIAFSAAAHGEVGVGPARLSVAVSPAASALTVVELPPFGNVEAPTHRGPTRVTLRLKELDVVSTSRMIEKGELSSVETLSPDVARSLPLAGLSTLLWTVLGGGAFAAGCVGALVAFAFRRRLAVVSLAVALAVSVPLAAVGVAYATWDVSAFREPTLRGNLIYAPQLIDVFSTRVASIKRLREQAVKVANDIASYYADERSISSGGALPGTHRVVHVTDLHLDPVGAELARSIVRSYEASLVIDTGDLPILGAEAETQVFASVLDTSVPRVYVPGNHDSPASLTALRGLGVTVLTSGTIEVQGLRIFGVPDPISRGFGVEPARELITDVAERAWNQLSESLRSGEPTPDIVAVHNPLMEKPFVGVVPLILSGHTHSARLYVSGGTARLNSGTLGGLPYDPSKSEKRVVPYSASVLYFTKDEPRRLIAIDRIAVYSNRSTTVSREVIDEELLP